jgi:hypothetical protein
LSIEAIASESLSGTAAFELNGGGAGRWGYGGSTTAMSLGADGTGAIELRHAYIDWLVPDTDLKFRMGVQPIALPSFTTQSIILVDDVAGVTASYKFNENFSLTAVWARPYNDNSALTGTKANYMDNVDAFALVLPLRFDGINITPWGMYAGLGPNFNATGTSAARVNAGMLPLGGARHKNGDLARHRIASTYTPTFNADGTVALDDNGDPIVTETKNYEDDNPLDRFSSYGNAFWVGLTGEVTALDPFRIAWDVNYGSVDWIDDGRLHREGWLASLLFEYKLDWAIPGIYGWYGSGDDSNPSNGSERMPIISTGNTNNQFSDFAMNGAPYDHRREGILSDSMTGTWGVGARLKDMNFIEKLKHTFWVNLMGGTNSPAMARKTGIAANASRSAGKEPLYMTTLDSALELGLRNQYKMYDNFEIYLEGAYIATWLDHSRTVWGKSVMNGTGGSDQVRDPWNINLEFIYSF